MEDGEAIHAGGEATSIAEGRTQKSEIGGLVETGGEGGINGGIMTPQKGPWPGNLAFYIDVDDLDIYSERILQAGGKILVDMMDVPGVGKLSLFSDPDGRVLGMWKQLPSAQ